MKIKVKCTINQEKAEDFIGYGTCCVNTADLLFRRAKEGDFPKDMYPSGILLLHGIELLLKAFLLLQGRNLPHTHSILFLYKKCAERDGLHRGELWASLQLLARWFAENTIDARYAVLEGKRAQTMIAHNTFLIVKNELIFPLKALLEKTSGEIT